VAPVSSEREVPATVDPTRWTGYADAIGETDEIPEAPLEATDEELSEAEEAMEDDADVELAPVTE
jgi:hypothetical protein